MKSFEAAIEHSDMIMLKVKEVQLNFSDSQILGIKNLFTDSKKDYSLHFDLTVPFARYVLDHLQELTFPFKRYQMQPVWR